MKAKGALGKREFGAAAKGRKKQKRLGKKKCIMKKKKKNTRAVHFRSHTPFEKYIRQ